MIDPFSAYLHARSAAHGPLVLMYHSVTPEAKTPEWPWAVSQLAFARQLDFLAAAGYLTPTFGELLGAPAGFAGKRVAVISFDDGYVDNLAAVDALTQRGMRASWFVVTGSVGKPPAWVKDDVPRQRLLDAGALRAMAVAGMEIGSHTVSHLRLPTLADDALHAELNDSKSMLEDLLGAPVSSFAYPYGAWDARCADAVEQAGYRCACTTRSGWALRDANPYRVRRLTVSHTDTVATFARKLSVADNDVAWSSLVRRRWQGVCGGRG